VWLPVVVPPGADYLVFDFTATGDGVDDALVFGLNGVREFSLAARFIPPEEPQASPLLSVSGYAGTTNELFFGIVGGSSTNYAVRVDNVRFFSVGSPTLTASRAGEDLVLSWPRNADDHLLETTGNVSAGLWRPVTNAPTLFAGRYAVTNAAGSQVQFYRLREL